MGAVFRYKRAVASIRTMSDEGDHLDILERLDTRKQRCRRRLEIEPVGYTYFALVGADLDGERCSIGDFAFIRRVEDAPNQIELAGVLQDKAILSAVHRYSPSIRHELVVRNQPDNLNATLAAAWAIAAALRIRTISDFLVPLAAAHSWSTMAALVLTASLLDRQTSALRSGLSILLPHLHIC